MGDLYIPKNRLVCRFLSSFSWTQKCRFYVKMNGQYPQYVGDRQYRVAGEPQTAKKADGQYPQYVGDRQYMVAGEPQTAKKAAKRSPTELEKGEIKRQRMNEEEEEVEEEEDFDSEEEDFEDESDEEVYSEYEQGFQEEPEEDLDGRGCGKPCCLNRLEAMAAMAAEMAARGAQEGPTPEVQLEDFGGEQIPDCCQEQIKLLLDDQLNGDEGKTLKDCCTGIWSGFRRFGFRWYKFRLFKQVYAPNGVKEKACETLGVPMMATEDEIKRAYLKLARRLHPDKNPNRTEEEDTEFKKILKAYETLVGKRS